MQNLFYFNTACYFFSERNEKKDYIANGKFQICIENEKIKKPRTSHQGKIMNSRCDVKS